jgi:hypothetical protein
MWPYRDFLLGLAFPTLDGSDTTCWNRWWPPSSRSSSWLTAGPARYHEPALPQVSGPPELQHIRPWAFLTQKTSLIGEGFSRLICCAPPPSLHDTGLNPNNLPLSHTSGCPRHDVTLPRFFIGFSFLWPQVLALIMELACSRPGSLRACAPTGPRSIETDNI